MFGARLFGLSFDPSRKALLTKEQFKEVYDYQQKYGYGIGDLDPDDVVMDMIAADSVRGTRRYNISGAERINKYGETSSLFVGNDGTPLPGSFGGSVVIEGKMYRLSVVQADLINGDKNYPGVSEMYDDISVAWDQRYMTASQYVKHMYAPPPTSEDAFYAIKGGSPTIREMKWLGVDVDWSSTARE